MVSPIYDAPFSEKKGLVNSSFRVNSLRLNAFKIRDVTRRISHHGQEPQIIVPDSDVIRDNLRIRKEIINRRSQICETFHSLRIIF